jgi:hypothetical protein
VGGAAGAVVGRNISESQSKPQSANSNVRPPAQPGTTIAVNTPGVTTVHYSDGGCSWSKGKNPNHPGKGWAKGHNKHRC